MSSDLDDHRNQLAVAQQLPADLMLLKMEGETIMAAGAMRPRDPVKILDQLVRLIDAFPASADEAIYSKPVGTVLKCVCANCKKEYEAPFYLLKTRQWECPRCDSNRIDGEPLKVKKFAEGLSIRAAETIRNLFQFNRLATRVEETVDGRGNSNGSVRISCTFIDYCTGTLTSDERIVRPYYTNKKGQQTRTPEDRFMGVVVQADKSKLQRDVILKSIPNELKAAYADACEKKLSIGLDADFVEKTIIPAFEKEGVTLEDLEKIVGRPARLGWTEADNLKLKKIIAAIRTGEITVRELLQDDDHEDSGPPAQARDLADVTGKAPTKPAGNGTTVKAEDKPAPKTEPPQEPAVDWDALVSELISAVNLSQTAEEVQGAFRFFAKREPPAKWRMQAINACRQREADLAKPAADPYADAPAEQEETTNSPAGGADPVAAAKTEPSGATGGESSGQSPYGRAEPFITAMRKAQTRKDVSALYDDACGPESYLNDAERAMCSKEYHTNIARAGELEKGAK